MSILSNINSTVALSIAGVMAAGLAAQTFNGSMKSRTISKLEAQIADKKLVNANTVIAIMEDYNNAGNDPINADNVNCILWVAEDPAGRKAEDCGDLPSVGE